MKKIIVVNSSDIPLEKLPWISSLENNIKGLGINVDSFSFPVLKRNSYGEWAKHMDFLMVENEEDIGIIAYGDGASFVVRYLSENKKNVKMFISIASSVNDGFEVSGQNKKDFSKLVKHRYSIYSNMDPVCSEKELEKFAIDIKASRSVVGFGGHFDSKSNIKEVPYIIDIVKEIIVKERKNSGRVVLVGQEDKVSDATLKKYKELKEYLSTKFRYVTTPLTSIEHVGKEPHKFKRYTDLIKESEIVIIDVQSSLEVGVEMMMAISMEKPTLVVAKSSITIPDIVSSAYGEKNIKRYRNADELINIIGGYLDA